MARIKIECLEGDKNRIFDCLTKCERYCPFEGQHAEDICNEHDLDCKICIAENVEFVIKEEK